MEGKEIHDRWRRSHFSRGRKTRQKTPEFPSHFRDSPPQPQQIAQPQDVAIALSFRLIVRLDGKILSAPRLPLNPEVSISDQL